MSLTRESALCVCAHTHARALGDPWFCLVSRSAIVGCSFSERNMTSALLRRRFHMGINVEGEGKHPIRIVLVLE